MGQEGDGSLDIGVVQIKKICEGVGWMDVEKITKTLCGCGNGKHTCEKCIYYDCADASECHFKAMRDAAVLIDSLNTQLKRKCQHEQSAVKCICDIETYLELGSPKYIKKTIEAWRSTQKQDNTGIQRPVKKC